MKKTEIEYCLESPIKYTPDGSGTQADGFKLILKAPSGKNIAKRAILKQQLMIAFQWMQAQRQQTTQDAKPQSDTKMTDDDIKALGEGLSLAIYVAPGVDIERILGEFAELLIQGACSVEGEKDLTRSLFEKIPLDDVDAMLGQYLANFIMPF